jgi:hypothetical protein
MQKYRRFIKNKFRAFILKHSAKLNFSLLSKHPLVDFYFIKTHPEFRWTDNIGINPNITMDIIRYYPEYNWDYQQVSANPNITIEYILSTPKKDWCWHAISCTLKTIVESVDLYPHLDWNWQAISYNDYITEEFVLCNQDKIFDRYFLALNPNISIDFILRYPQFNWNPDFICLNPNIKPEDLERLKYVNWSMASETIDMDFIFSSPEFPWVFSSLNKTIRDGHILSHPEIEWDWKDLACNPSISPELIRSQERNFLFRSPSISINELDRNDLTYLDLDNISINNFENSIDKLDFAQKIIYFFWIPKCYDPERESGKRMAQHTLKKFMELVE